MIEGRRTVSESDLARLKREREEADRRYNVALTAVDAAIRPLPEFPHPPPAPDETQVTPLNTRWKILETRPAFPSGWRGRLARFVWQFVEPPLRSQEAFNAALVDHVNRNIAPQREVPKAIGSAMTLLAQQVEQLVHFQSRLIVYLQQVTAYVDTKDYEFAGLGRRVAEDAAEEIERLDRTARGLAAALSGTSDEMLRRFESLLARDERYGARLDEIRTSLAVAQEQVLALRREIERRGPSAAAPPVTPARDDAPSGGGAAVTGAFDGRGSAWKYLGFENLFRGSPEVIRARVEEYVPIFAGATEVLDVGCGRGELLEALGAAGIQARGIDVNQAMVDACRARGLDVAEADALEYLRAQPDGSLGGFVAAQVVEHLEPAYLLAMLDEAARVLRPGAALVLETINAACWLAFFESYLRDITHARALHPDTLKYLVTASGFVDAEVRFTMPIAPADRLQPAPKAVQGGGAALAALAGTFDGNVERLNRLLFTHLDYAVVARRP